MKRGYGYAFGLSAQSHPAPGTLESRGRRVPELPFTNHYSLFQLALRSRARRWSRAWPRCRSRPRRSQKGIPHGFREALRAVEVAAAIITASANVDVLSGREIQT